MRRILKAKRIFDGERMLHDHAVVIDGRLITEVVKFRGEAQQVVDLGDCLLAPGFIDVQLNGGGGVNLNETPKEAGVQIIARAHQRFGTTGLLPTVITDTPDVQRRAVAAVAAARSRNPAVMGVHIEGPFIDPARKGAHDAKLIRAMTDEDVAWLSNLRCGVVLVTVAPNTVMPAHIAALAKAGVLVSLGHAEAPAQDVHAALAAGATGFTHMFNAMSQFGPREAGMVGAALACENAYCGIIADGFHVEGEVLKLAFAVRPKDKMMLVTDAMSPSAGGPDSFSLQGRRVNRSGGKLTLEDGTLAGSNLTMDEALRFCVNRLDMSLEDVLPMTSTIPARFLGLGEELGRIKAGYLASLVQLDGDLKVADCWVEGKGLNDA